MCILRCIIIQDHQAWRKQQRRQRRLSPDTLQRLHEEGLAKLQTVQEAELELLMLQQTHEKVVMQQEAARVARELDQQQLLALLQRQQHAAEREQVEQSVGLIQQVTRGLLEEHFNQLRDEQGLGVAGASTLGSISAGASVVSMIDAGAAGAEAAVAGAQVEGEQDYGVSQGLPRLQRSVPILAGGFRGAQAAAEDEDEAYTDVPAVAAGVRSADPQQRRASDLLVQELKSWQQQRHNGAAAAATSSASEASSVSDISIELVAEDEEDEGHGRRLAKEGLVAAEGMHLEQNRPSKLLIAELKHWQQRKELTEAAAGTDRATAELGLAAELQGEQQVLKQLQWSLKQ
eukprot:gene7058-7272_t